VGPVAPYPSPSQACEAPTTPPPQPGSPFPSFSQALILAGFNRKLGPYSASKPLLLSAEKWAAFNTLAHSCYEVHQKLEGLQLAAQL
jgi:hypothetical protein